MKIVEDYQVPYQSETIKIESAKYIGDFAVRIKFSDGKEKLVDFKSFLMNSHHPSIKKYQNESLFKDFEILDGNLNWNNYDLIFPVWDLYTGSIGV